ncbi:MAG: hypothetical protein L6V35_04140 [Alistipes putredinis]|nr:MAG: hypothetical protein L6V35_04140 [Alistipes putredinis]
MDFFPAPSPYRRLAFLQDSEGEYVASMFLENGTVVLSDTEPVGTPANDASKRYMTQIGEIVNEFYDRNTSAGRRAELQLRETVLMDSTISANADNIFRCRSVRSGCVGGT